MSQYDRFLSISLGGQNITTLDGNPDDALRVRFKIEQGTTQTLNTCHAIVTNLSPTSMQALTQMATQKAKLQITAGYVDNNGLLFQGDTLWSIAGRESPTDTALQLFARDAGNAYDYAIVSKSLQKGSTPIDHFNVFLQAMQPYGVTQGYIPTELMSTPVYSQGVAFAGMVKDYMRVLASSLNCTWSLQNGALQLAPVQTGIPGGAITLNSATGLIGMPTQTFAGITIRCLINPAIHIESIVSVDQSLIQGATPDINLGTEAQLTQLPNIATDGLYRVLHIDVTGDTRGNDWYQDLSCVAQSNPGFIPNNLNINAKN